MARIEIFADDSIPTETLAQIRPFVFDVFDGRFSEDDWDHSAGAFRIVGFDGEVPVAHAAVVPRRLQVGDVSFRAGYVEAVATARSHQQQGLASLLMTQATSLVRAHFEFGGLATPLVNYYERFGWERWTGPSFVQDGPKRLRTAEDDDGIMVLRFGASADADLAAPITCDSRSGDRW